MSHIQFTKDEIAHLQELNTFDAKVLNKRFKELFELMRSIEKNVKKKYKLERPNGQVIEFANGYLDVVGDNLRNVMSYSQDMLEYIYSIKVATEKPEETQVTEESVESTITEVELPVMEDEDETVSNWLLKRGGGSVRNGPATRE